jgi:sugar-specific transcriptional regulator TrmB
MSPDILLKAVIQLGASPFVAQVYAKLVLMPQISISELATHFEVQRKRIYQALDELEKLDVLGQKEENSRSLNVKSPSKLIALLKRKETESKRISSDLIELLPDLLSTFNQSSPSSYCKIYEGKDQITEFYEKLLDESKEEILSFGSLEKFVEYVEWDYVQHWSKRRVQKGIFARTLSIKTDYVDSVSKKDFKELREIRWLPKDFNSDCMYGIHGSTLSLWNPVLPKVIAIEDRLITGLFKQNFEYFWQSVSK